MALRGAALLHPFDTYWSDKLEETERRRHREGETERERHRGREGEPERQ